MVKKFWKKITASVLTLAMTLGMMVVVPVQAADKPLEFDANNTYALITSNNKAVNVNNINWGENDTMANGDYIETTQKVNSTSVFRLTPFENQDGVEADEIKVKMEYLDSEGNTHTIRSEGNDFIFADPQNRGATDTTGDNLKMCTYIIKKVADGKGIIKDATRGYYLSVNENNEIRKLGNDASQAETFTFVENPSIIDMTVTIQHATSGRYVTFAGVTEDKQTVGLADSTLTEPTDNEKFTAGYATNTAGGVYDNAITLKSLGQTGYLLGSEFWNGSGATIQVGAYYKSTDIGAWEGLTVVPAGDGKVIFKDPQYGKLISINDDGQLVGDLDREPTENDKFIINSTITPTASEDLKCDDRSQDEVSLSWTNPSSLYTDVQVLQKGTEDADFSTIANLTSENSYKVTGLNSGTVYSFKLRFINKDAENFDDSNEVTVTTRTGVQPAQPTNVKLTESEDGQKLTISWDKAENAQQYKIVRAPSMYGEYEDVEGSVTTATSYEFETPTTNKYDNYYRVVAINGDEESVRSEFVSLERNLFGENVYIFAPTDDVEAVNQKIEEIFNLQNDRNANAQFNENRFAIYFKPGDYTTLNSIKVGFYTQVSGLGYSPMDVKLNNMETPAYLVDNNATCNFWRSAENLSIINTGYANGRTTFNDGPEMFAWAVAQAAPLRRIYSERETHYDWNGWASGGYVADSYIANKAGTWGGQQFYTRNSEVTDSVYGCTLNAFYQGVISPNLPTTETEGWTALEDGKGYSNWSIPNEKGEQQIVTSITSTPVIREKPFLYYEDGEYKVFVPEKAENTSGTTWHDKEQQGTSYSLLEKFYVAKEGDSAKDINTALKDGQNVFFTPGIYHAEEAIQISNEGTIVLGTGMASIIPDNTEAAMKVADVDNVTVAGLIFDAGTQNSEYLLQVGEKDASANHEDNPTLLADLFFRIGGTTDEATTAQNALEINSNNVIGDHFWIWRADHGTGVSWHGNAAQHGLVVNGDDVTCYALFNEHFENYNTLWNGERGATYFYQNETAYDAISQNKDNEDAWLSHNGATKGYASYKVANDVEEHYAVGLGIYNVFIYTGGGGFNEGQYDGGAQIELDNGIEVPNKSGVVVENACMQSFAKSGAEGGLYQTTNHIINGVGGSVSSGFKREETRDEEDGSLNGNLLDKDGNVLPTKIYKIASQNEHGLTEFKYVIRELDENGNEIVLNGDGQEIDLEKMKSEGFNYVINQNNGQFEVYTSDWNWIGVLPSWLPVRENPIGKAVKGKGWSRVFLTKYCNGEATFNTENPGENDPYLTTLTNVKQLGDDGLDVATLEALVSANQNLVETDYTAESWEKFATALADAQEALTDDYLRYATSADFNTRLGAFKTAIEGLQSVADKTALKNEYDSSSDILLNKDSYTSDSYANFEKAYKDAETVLGNKAATQTQVNNATQVLKDAKAALVKVQPTNPDNGNDKPTDPNTGNSGNGNSSNTGNNNTNNTNNPSKGNSSTKTDSKTHSTKKGVKTGDDSAIALFATLGLLSAGTYTVLRRKREN